MYVSKEDGKRITDKESTKHVCEYVPSMYADCESVKSNTHKQRDEKKFSGISRRINITCKYVTAAYTTYHEIAIFYVRRCANYAAVCYIHR